MGHEHGCFFVRGTDAHHLEGIAMNRHAVVSKSRKRQQERLRTLILRPEPREDMGHESSIPWFWWEN